MRIVVASSESSTRQAIGMLIDAQSDLELVGRIADVADLVLEVKQENPDLVVLDWETLGTRIGTLQKLLDLVQQSPAIVVLSVNEQARSTAIDSGAAGFAYKGDSPESLLSEIRAARLRKKDQREPARSYVTEQTGD